MHAKETGRTMPLHNPRRPWPLLYRVKSRLHPSVPRIENRRALTITFGFLATDSL
jgi:hypothetical protein